MTRSLSKLVASLLLCLGLVSAAQAQETLRVAVQAPFFVDPHLLFFGPDMAVVRHIFDSLVGRDAEARWTPSLAESWRPIDDRTWEFALRRGVTFHDGTPSTAADVLATFARVPAIPNNPASYIPNLRTITSTEVIGPADKHLRAEGGAGADAWGGACGDGLAGHHVAGRVRGGDPDGPGERDDGRQGRPAAAGLCDGELTPALTTLRSFNKTNGANPYAGLPAA